MVETVEAAIKKHKDFTTTMELNLHRIKAVIEAGESLISQSNIYSERIKERIDTLANRCHEQTSPDHSQNMLFFIPTIIREIRVVRMDEERSRAQIRQKDICFQISYFHVALNLQFIKHLVCKQTGHVCI